MVRAGLALRRQQHAALGGSELLSESRAAALIAAVRALLCGAVPVCVHGFLVNMQEIVGRIGGDAAAPRGGAVGAALRIRSGDSWERFHSFVAPDGDREPVISPRRPPSARARSRSRSFDTLESMSGATSRKVGGAWGLARGVTQSLALLPFQVVAARCGIAGPFVGFPDLLDPSPSALAGPDDVRRWLQRRGTAVVLQGQWERSLWRPMMLFPFVRESLLAALDTMRGVGMQLQLQLAPRLRFGWTDRTGSSPLRRFFEGSWSAGLFAGGDACLVNALIGLGATAGLGLGVVLSFPSILTFYSVLDDLRSDGQSAQSRSGILASVWEKALAVTMTDAGRSRLWEHAKTSMYTLPYSLMSLALGRAAVRLLFGGPSKKEWVRFAARRHFLRKFFYTHSEAYRAHNERRGESKLRRMKENVAVSFAPETSAVVNLPRETSGEKRLSSSLKNSSFERRRAEHERKEHLAAQENGSNGSLSPASKAAVTKSPWGEIRPIEELVDEYGGLQGATQNTGEAPVPIFSSNGVVKAPKTSSPRNGDGSHLPILEPNVFRSITDLSAPPEESVDSREDSWASTSSSSTGATRPVAVCSASPVADRLLVSSSPESTTKLSPKLVPIAFSGYEKPVRSANEPSARKRPDPSRLLESFRGGKPNAASVPILYPSASEKKLRDGGSFDEAGPIGLVLSDDELNNIQRKRSLGLTRVRKSPLVEHTE
uniref:Uncharacterized protein n=1 Tax=Pinguiococcus pyrenoidosus TaxID=172671 RepID=A0A7R9U9I0_9STRA